MSDIRFSTLILNSNNVFGITGPYTPGGGPLGQAKAGKWSDNWIMSATEGGGIDSSNVPIWDTEAGNGGAYTSTLAVSSKT